MMTEEPKKSEPGYDMSIHSNPDAKAWAAEFKKTFPDADEELMHGWFANAMMAMSDHKDRTELRPSEVLFAFCAWLTTRKKEITVGSNKNAAPIVPLISEFMKSQDFDEPRDDFTDRIKAYPKD